VSIADALTLAGWLMLASAAVILVGVGASLSPRRSAAHRRREEEEP